jgi:predicted amidohydrolase YtcJ
MKEPFLDGSRGQWMTNPDDITDTMDQYWKSGFQIHVHTNGDKAMQVVIDNVKRLQKGHQRPDHKTTIEHAGYFTQDQADDLAKLGCFVSAQPFYYYALTDIYSKFGLGKEKAALISPLKWLTDRNIPTALHSDFTMAPAKPLMQIWVAVNRISVNGIQSKDVKSLGLSAEDAFDAVTITVRMFFEFINFSNFCNFTFLGC